MKNNLLVELTLLKAVARKADSTEEIIQVINECLEVIRDNRPTKKKSDTDPTKDQ